VQNFKTRKFKIKNKEKEFLVGDYLFKDEKRKKVIIAIHGYITTRNYGIKKITDTLAEEGFDCIRFDLSGCGESQGNHAEKTITTWSEDTEIIVNYAKKLGYKKIALLGSSLGANCALNVAIQQKIDNLCLTSPGIDYYNKKLKLDGKKYLYAWKKRGCIELINNKGVKWRSNYSFIEDAKKHQFFGKLKELKSKTLFLYGTLDDEVMIASLKKLAKEIPNKKIKALKNADHKLKINEDDTKGINTIIQWFKEWK
jgi:esterase/lipase